MSLLLKRIVIILGLLLVITSICIGISIIIFSFKFLDGSITLNAFQYFVIMLAIGIAGFCIGFLGILIIYTASEEHK